ncbi:hypothetical protein ACIQZG_11470 [Lysinibacillus sp. NPDC096418]|uniref:hypothetical protein n=1 Tax=Lysinibacillus sp. NPDC096418 TaxID=3364138 RepID=UPI003806557A
MVKRILIIAGILLVGIATYSMLTKLIEDDTNKKMKESLVIKEEQSIAVLREKLHEKYVGVDVKTTSQKDLVIQVVADEVNFYSLKKDMASIVKSVIETSPLKNYKVVFERWELSSINDEAHPLLIKTLANGLKQYEVFENIVIEAQAFIMVNTSIKGLNKDAREVAMEMKEKVNEMFHSKELNSIADIESYEIVILNASGEAIN